MFWVLLLVTFPRNSTDATCAETISGDANARTAERSCFRDIIGSLGMKLELRGTKYMIWGGEYWHL